MRATYLIVAVEEGRKVLRVACENEAVYLVSGAGTFDLEVGERSVVQELWYRSLEPCAIHDHCALGVCAWWWESVQR